MSTTKSDERTKRDGGDADGSRSSSDGRSTSREGFPRTFGGYVLLGAFGKGGMGEVYLARRGGIEGIEKLCVLKLLRADLASEKEYVGRFLDEARVVIGLQHANICPVFDVGRVGDALYLAMEYLHGVNLRHVTDRLEERGRRLTPEVAVHIASSTLAALHHAHRHEDPATGAKLDVVHRDVSPHNVMITFQGEVKLIDFGLAASTVKKEETESQLVMGKVAYMSPEQARGEHVDARTDQFATAIVLYELLVGERFYGARKTHEIWQVVGPGGYVPPRLDLVDESLRAVLRRALAETPEARFSSCEDFREELLEWLSSRAPIRTERVLRELMQDVFVDDIDNQRAMAQRLLARDDAEGDGDPTFSSGPTVMSTVRREQRVAALPADVNAGPPPPDARTPSRPSASSRGGRGAHARSEHDSSTEATLSSTKLALQTPTTPRSPALAAMTTIAALAVAALVIMVGRDLVIATPEQAPAETIAAPPLDDAPRAPSDAETSEKDPSLPVNDTTSEPTPSTTDARANPSDAHQDGEPVVDVAPVVPVEPVDALDVEPADTATRAPVSPRTAPRPKPPITGVTPLPVVTPIEPPPAPVVVLPPPTPTEPEAAPPTTAPEPTPPPPDTVAKPDLIGMHARLSRCPLQCAKTTVANITVEQLKTDPERAKAFLTVAENCLPSCPR